MNTFFDIIKGLYSNETRDIIHTLHKYSLCHVEEVDGINQEAIHTGFYFLTRHDKLCEVYYLVNEKKLCFQGVLDKSWYLCPFGCCHYRIQTDYENGFRIRIMCPDESKMKIYYKCNMIKNKCSIRTDYESTSTIRDGYHLVIPTKYNFFSFIGPSSVKNFPLYSPIFPRLIISNGSHFYIDDPITE